MTSGSGEMDLRRELGELSAAQRALLEHLLEREGGDPSGVTVAPRERGEGAPPLSFGQRGLWLASQEARGSRAYVMPALLRLGGRLSVAALARGLEEVVVRHEALRTGVELEGGRPVQRIERPRRVEVPVVDLRGLGARAREAESLRLAAAVTGRPFRLDRPPLWRCALMRLAEREHRLALAVHHLVADRASMEQVLDEWLRAYRAVRRGAPAGLGAPGLQPADLAIWERERWQGERLEREVAFWRRALREAEPLAELPADRERPDAPSGRGRRLRSSLPPDLARDLRELARARGMSLFLVLLAAWRALLARYTGKTRLVVGVPVAGRDRPELTGVVGLLVNTLPLCTEAGGASRFEELLEAERDAFREARAHHELPFSKLVEELRPRRDRRYHPVYQVMFSLQEPTVLREAPEGLELEELEVHNGSAQVDLTLVVFQQPGGGIRTEWEYDTDLFDKTRILRAAGHYRELLRGALAEPGRPLARLPLLSAPERHQVLLEPEPLEAVPAAGRCLHEPVAEWASRTPDTVALCWDGRALTYGELMRRADRLTGLLRLLCQGDEPRIGVLLEHSFEAVEVLLAIFKAGAVYVPLDPNYPRERLERMVAEAGVQLVVSRRAVWEAAGEPGGLARALFLERSPSRTPTTPERSPVPERLAYVIFTSGSTGTPKGVAVEHGPATRHFTTWSRHLDLGPADRALQFASLAFDASLEQILPPLYAGACVVFQSEVTLGPRQLVRWLEERAVTAVHLPMAYWRQVVRDRHPVGPAVRLVNPGGDVMPPGAARAFREAAQGPAPPRLLNGYGPTETIVTTSAYDVPADLAAGRLPRRIPISGFRGLRRMALLGAGGEPVALGVAGELHVGGPLLARGYLGRPGLTASRFVPDPHAGSPGGRNYRTGDLAVRRADGAVEFLGRTDHQVKLRGFRIELGEVEAALRELEGVVDAAAVLREGPAGASLVAFAVPADGEPRRDAGDLRRALEARLPGFMVPAAVAWLDELPRTITGKVDRGALPRIADGPRSGAGPGEEPRNEVERLLARLWADALKLDLVGVTDNFFALGGDSIVSLEIISRAQEEGLTLTPAQFFRFPTIAGLARVAGVRREAEQRPGLAEEGDAPGPLTPIQRWFFEAAFPAPHHWNQAVLVEVRESTAPRLLHRALGVLVARHEALRYRFVEGDGGVRQEPCPGAGRVLTVVHLDALPEGAAERALEELSAEAQGSLDPRRGRVVRTVLFRGARGAPDRLLWVVHHLVIDGVSWRILLDELERLLDACDRREPAALPAPTISLRRWARCLEEAVPELERSEGRFWAGMAEDAARVPDLLPREPAGGGRGAPVTLELSLDPRETRRVLEEPVRAYGASTGECLVAALAAALARHAGSFAVWLELESHGRTAPFADADLTRTVGWLAAKYPMLLDLSGLPEPWRPGDILREVKDRVRAIPGNGTGYGPLRYAGSRELRERLVAAPAPEVHFNYLGRLDIAERSGRLQRVLPGGAGPECAPVNPAPQPLEVVALQIDGRLELRWKLAAGHGDAGRLAALADGFLEALRSILDHSAAVPERVHTVSDFPLLELAPAELERLRSDYPRLEDVYPLSPVQEGMLFHSLEAPESGVYVEQLACELEGELDPDLFERAWNRVTERHPALRTAFAWRGLDRPVQVVSQGVEVPFRVLDWSGLDEARAEARQEELLRRDRISGFDPARLPLMRLALIRRAGAVHRFVWTVHHLLLDGWAEPLVLEEVFETYFSLARGRRPCLAPPRPFRQYVEWLQGRDPARADAFWRRTLRGFSRPCLLPPDLEPGEEPAGHREEELRLPEELSRRLVEQTRSLGITLNTCVAGAWVLVLGHATGVRDVVTGLTVSGRPADLPGAQEIVGLFINTLPLRAPIEPGSRIGDWLGGLQRRTAELFEFEHSSLVEVQAASEVPRGAPLFDTIVVFMNQPREYGDLVRRIEEHGLRLRSTEGIEQTNYPFTVTVFTGERVSIQVNYREDLFSRERVRGLLDCLAGVIEDVAADPAERVERVLLRLADRDRRSRGEEASRLRALGRDLLSRARRRAQGGSPPDAKSHETDDSDEVRHEATSHYPA